MYTCATELQQQVQFLSAKIQSLSKDDVFANFVTYRQRLLDQVKVATGVATAGPYPNFIANCCVVLVFWRWMELAFGTAPRPSISGGVFFWATFVALPACEIHFDKDRKPKAPPTTWKRRRCLLAARDFAGCVAACSALEIFTRSSTLRTYAFAVLLSSSLSLLGNCSPRANLGPRSWQH